MFEEITNYFQNKKIEKRRNNVSDIRLKDLILKSNKDKVIHFALTYILSNNYDKCIEEYNFLGSDNYISPICNEKHLRKILNDIYLLSENEYNNNYLVEYELYDGIGILDYDLFISMIHIDTQVRSIDRFISLNGVIHLNNKDDNLPIQFMINCRLNKNLLQLGKTKIVALSLLQIILIQETNRIIKEGI